jgi:hypothetical protein
MEFAKAGVPMGFYGHAKFWLHISSNDERSPDYRKFRLNEMTDYRFNRSMPVEKENRLVDTET